MADPLDQQAAPDDRDPEAPDEATVSDQLERILTQQAELSTRTADGQVQTLGGNGKPRPAIDVLVDIGCAQDLWHDVSLTGYCRVNVNNHQETYPVESEGFRGFLMLEYLKQTEHAVTRSAVTDAVATLTKVAVQHRPLRPVWLRVGLWTRADEEGVGILGGAEKSTPTEPDEAIVIDTGDPDWSVIRITKDGWTTAPGSSVRLLRPGKALPLAKPSTPDFGRLWNYLNIKPEDRVLIAGWLLCALRPDKPYAPILLSGEQGSGKSTFTKMLKAVVDPSVAGLRAPPKEVRDLLVAAANSWVLCYDNLSYLSPMLSDALCRLSTGGAIAERTLYTNYGETLIEVMRPVILNGIEELCSRPDLAERGIHIELTRPERRRSEMRLWPAFKADLPHILAGLLDGLVMAMARVESTEDSGERMSDTVMWAEAGLTALGFSPGDFATAYRRNQKTGIALGLEASPAGRALLTFMEANRSWSGSMGDLLKALRDYGDDEAVRSKVWPKSPRGMRGVLSRLGPALRVSGVEVSYHRGSDGGRLVSIHQSRDTAAIAEEPTAAATGGDYGADDGEFMTGHDAGAVRI